MCKGIRLTVTGILLHELLASAEMAVGLQISSNASSQDVVNKLFTASFQNPFLCFIPSPRKVGITQFKKSMAFCGIYSKYSSEEETSSLQIYF